MTRISNEEIEDMQFRLKRCAELFCDGNGNASKSFSRNVEMLDRLKELEAKEYSRRWIPLKELKPEYDKTYQIAVSMIGSRYMYNSTLVYRSDNMWHDVNFNLHFTTDHLMYNVFATHAREMPSDLPEVL